MGINHMISGYTLVKFTVPDTYGATAAEVAASIKSQGFDDVGHFLSEMEVQGHLCLNVPADENSPEAGGVLRLDI